MFSTIWTMTLAILAFIASAFLFVLWISGIIALLIDKDIPLIKKIPLFLVFVFICPFSAAYGLFKILKVYHGYFLFTDKQAFTNMLNDFKEKHSQKQNEV